MNFKQSTIVTIGFLFLAIVMCVDYKICFYVEQTFLGNIMRVLWYMIGIVILLEYSFIFPLIAKFNNTTKNMMINALLLPILKLQWALPVVLINVLCMVITVWNASTILFGAAIWILFGVAVVCYLQSYFLLKVMEPYLES